jgi:hypothetical protein
MKKGFNFNKRTIIFILIAILIIFLIFCWKISVQKEITSKLKGEIHSNNPLKVFAKLTTNHAP